MKLGVVDVGGGLRGIYGAGVLDRCLEDGIRFGCCIGVSAGSANLASYLAGQKGRNYQFYHDYAFRREYMSAGHLLRTGNYLNMDYIYGQLSNSGGENPLDYPAFAANPAQYIVVAEEALTGRAKYFTRADFSQDDYRPMMASCNIPVINRPYRLNGIGYYDGGLADPVPLAKAFAEGCGAVVLILTKPLSELRTSRQDALFAKLLRLHYPRSARQLLLRAQRYNRAVAQAQELAQRGKVLLVAPASIEGMHTLTRDRQVLDHLYQRGYRDGGAIGPWLRRVSLSD